VSDKAEAVIAPTSPRSAARTCEEGEALRLEYLRWARLYSDAVVRLSELTKDPVEREFFIQLDATEKARIASGEARLAHERHRAEHGCLRSAAAASGT
jgi:DNA-binding PadR family transcriptional regulator